MNDLDCLERLALAANIFQVGSFFMNMEQLQNEDLMKALDYQNLNYLENIRIKYMIK